MKDWDKAYREKGEIQTWISDIIKDSVNLFKERNVKRILDLCFGTGRHVVFFAERGFDVYGIDISEKGKEITEKKIKEKGLKANLKIVNMKNLPFDDNFFDAIIAVYSIAHNTLSGLKKTISEMTRVLKPKGIIIATLISTKDPRFGTGKEIEPGTFINIDDPVDSDIPHRFSDENDIKELFSKFNFIMLEERVGHSVRRNAKCTHWEMIAEKI